MKILVIIVVAAFMQAIIEELRERIKENDRT